MRGVGAVAVGQKRFELEVEENKGFFNCPDTDRGRRERELLGISLFIKHKIFSRSHMKCFDIAVTLNCTKFIDKFNFP